MSVVQWIFLLALSTSHQKVFSQDVSKFTKAANCFSLQLMNKIKTTDNNIIMSGFSVDVVLQMLSKGAKGPTAVELNAVLQNTANSLTAEDVNKGFPSTIQRLTSDNNVTVSIANAMWIEQNYPVYEDYKKIVKETFLAEERSGDFENNAAQTTDDINAWVKDSTKAMIDKLFDKPLDPLTVLVLLNAIYFKGEWMQKFDTSKTTSQPFYNGGDSNSKKMVPLMNQLSKFAYKEDRDIKAKLLRMDYKGQTMSFIAVLPNEGISLDDVQKGLTCDNINDVLDITGSRKVNVTIPKFDVTSDMDLKQPLMDLNLKSVFGNPDLSGIGPGSLQVSKIHQKARIKVYEEGSEAAAVTGAVVITKSAIEPQIIEQFLANRPFYYYIVDNNSGLILFSGKLSKL